MRKDLLVEGQVYHVFSRSIARYIIFNTETDYFRMLEAVKFYQKEKPDISFSRYDKLLRENKLDFMGFHDTKNDLVQIIAYCIMPTHVHFVLKQNTGKGISVFMNNVLNSYTRYFNTKHERKGPLWESRFKSVLVNTNEYLLHLTRYVHLNPVTSELTDKPESWKASSYKEYLSGIYDRNNLTSHRDLITISSGEYKNFVEDRISYQQELHKIKDLLLE